MPLTAAALPEVSADFRRFVSKLQRGILFADDPVFKVTEQQSALPDGPERLALMHQANKLMPACMPCMAHNHPIVTDLLQPGVRGPLRHPFDSDWFRWADVGGGARSEAGRPAAATV